MARRNGGEDVTTVQGWAEVILDEALRADWIQHPGRVVLGNPTIDWSGCCDGLLGLELQSLDFSGDQWPRSGTYTQTPFGQDCASDIWVANWNLSIVRCVPTFDEGGAGERGSAPTPEALHASADGMFHDVRAVWKQLRCAISDWRMNYGNAYIGGWTPLAREGGCGGFEIDLATKVIDCEPCVDC
jgi:hypothetical protein